MEGRIQFLVILASDTTEPPREKNLSKRDDEGVGTELSALLLGACRYKTVLSIATL